MLELLSNPLTQAAVAFLVTTIASLFKIRIDSKKINEFVTILEICDTENNDLKNLAKEQNLKKIAPILNKLLS